MFRGRSSRHCKPKAARRLIWLALPASLATAAAALWAATPSFAAGTYRTTTAVNVRSGPGTGSPIIGTEPAGATFTLLCQWQGSTNIGGNSTWDDVTFANNFTGAITDYDTTTPSWNSYAPGTGPCGSNPAPAPAPNGGSLGGVNMQQACNSQYGTGLTAVATNANSAYSWQCVGPGVSRGINVTAECVVQYGYGAVAAASNPASAWSWYCLWNITGQMQAAANWAASQVHSTYSSHYGHNWSGWCEQFAEQAEGFQFSFGSAYKDYLAENSANRIHPASWNQTPPVGALVFYGGGAIVNGQQTGHVAVSIGNGQEIGTYGYAGAPAYPIQQYPVTRFLTNPYLGWAFPFGS